MRHSRLRIYIPVLLCALWTATLAAQTYPDTFAEGGILPTAVYTPGEFDLVNSGGGNLTVSVPIASMPKGRGGMGLDLALVYNSQMAWVISPALQSFGLDTKLASEIVPNLYGGWRYNVEYKLDLERRAVDVSNPSAACPNNDENLRVFQLRLVSPDGSFRVLHLSGGQSDVLGDGYYEFDPAGKASDCSNYLKNPDVTLTGDLTYFTTDGSFLKVVVEDVAGSGEDWDARPWTIYFPEGRKIEGIDNETTAIYDRNGNKISVYHFTCGAGACSGLLVDKFSQEIDTGVTRDLEIWHLANGDDEVHQTFSGGEALEWTVDWGTVSVGSVGAPVSYFCTSVGDTCEMINQLLPVVNDVTLPNVAGARAWTFDYWDTNTSPKGLGLLKSAEPPTGAVANYTYRWNQTHENDASVFLRNEVVSKDLVHDGDTDSWTYVFDEYDTGTTEKNTFTAPDGGTTTFYHYTPTTDFKSGLVFKIERSNGDVIEKVWAVNRPYEQTATADRGNAFVQMEIRSIRNSSNALSKSAAKTFDYDKNGNLIETTEYGWVNYSGPYTGLPSGSTAVRSTVLSYYNGTADSSSTSQDSDAYWNPASLNVRNALQRREVRAGSTGGTLKAATEITYDDEDSTANPTATWSWDSVKSGSGSGTLGSGNSVGTLATYDSYGNVLTQTDGEGNVTKYTYGLICPGCTSFDDLYPTQIESADGTSVERTTQLVYDVHSGQTVISNDVDNNVASQYVYDDDGRITQVLEGGTWNGSSYQSALRKTTYAYDDVNRKVRTESDLSTLNDGNLETVEHYDELGRVRLVRTSDGATLSTSVETDGIKVKSVYKTASGGNCQLQTNPYRTTSDDTMGWTRTRLDTNGRVTEVAMFSGSAEPSCTTTTNRTGFTATSYGTASDGLLVATAEQASDGDKKRSTVTDALGRLIHVTEDPDDLAYVTNYTYDVLDNLTAVDQGSVDRSYAYDSLSRLTSATNPESGTTSYTYDDNGQLTTRTDARSIVTTNTYDPLGRLTGRNYGAYPTPTATFIYGTSSAPDGNTGQLIEVRTGSAATKQYSYDKLGRIISNTQITDSQSYSFSYAYNLDDSATSITYPSGKTVVYDYQAYSGRLIEAGRSGDADYYLDAASYAAHGAPTSVALGNGVTETTDYNSRLQPIEIQAGSLLTLGFNYNTTDNNGNLLGQTITAPGMGSVTQHYKYDQLNRLSIGSEGAAPNGSAPNFTCSGSAAWCQTYHYDRYGNRGMQGTTPTPVLAPFCASSSGPGCNSSTTTLTPAYTTTSNRLNTTWATYDNAGNMLAFKDPIGSATRDWSAAYDGENKQTFFCGGTTATCNNGNADAQYVYDGEGNRVQVLTTGVTTTYVYDAFGRLAAEYSTASPAVAAGSYWRTTDHLGSTRLVTLSSGNVYDRRDLFPFGEQIADTFSSRSSGGNYNEADPASRHLFTGKERDVESGLDYSLARYLSSNLGRFTSADSPFADQFASDPQSWNLYSYVRNSPLSWVDLSGRCSRTPDGNLTDEGDQLFEGECSSQKIEDIPGEGGTVVSANLGLLEVNTSAISSSGSASLQSVPTVTIGPGPSTGMRIACGADAILRGALELYEFAGTAGTVSFFADLASDATGTQLNPVAAMFVGGDLIGQAGAIQGTAGLSSKSASGYATSVFESAGGQHALNTLRDHTTRNSFGGRSPKKQSGMLAELQRLTGLDKMAKYAGRVAKGIPVGGEVVTGVGCFTNN